MKLKKLKAEFFLDNPNLEQVLYDNRNKRRGYGIVVISYNSLIFGIPLHSNIDPKKGFETSRKTEVDPENPDKKITKIGGLDYQKAVLLFDENYYLDRSFKIDAIEFDKIVDNQEKIKLDFENYVLTYIKLHKEKKYQQLKREYKKSTLVNYHSDLDIS